MPVPNYTPVPPVDPEAPIDREPNFAFGTKESWYTFCGEQDGMEGAGPNSVQPGDEAFQSYYDQGWAYGNYFRTMSGVNGYNI